VIRGASRYNRGGRQCTGDPAMKMFAVRACALLLGLAPMLAAAQALPRPAEFYFDEDAAVARPVVAIAGSDEATINQLVRLMDRGGRNADRAVAQLAHLSMASGRVDTGRALYERALQMTTPRGQQHSAVRWNYGWDLYRLGEVEGALAQWIEAGANRGVVYPAWAPQLQALLPEWSDADRATLAEVLAAWREDPPAWR
jgi:tetratricopeptide (TPR) repeat protein